MKENTVPYEMIEDAAKALKNVAQRTPILTASRFSENILFKAENLQKTGSFKIRGAYNKIRTLTDEEAARGVIACSSGNHAQGVALSATKRGIKSVVCMPASAPLIKMEATKFYGAEVIPVPGNYDNAAEVAARLSKENGYTFVHPFDDPLVIAGQGTIGKEIIEQVPDVEQIVVPIGGGGLISGIALAVKTLKPSCKVIGVQAKDVPSMYGSFAFERIITVRDAATVADGIHVLTPGRLTFKMVSQYVDDVVLVTDDEISAAIVRLIEGQKIISEGAGATGMAAFMYNRIDTSKKTVCVISGGNVDMKTLSRIVTDGSIKLGRLAEIIIDLPCSTSSVAQVATAVENCGAIISDMRRDDFAAGEPIGLVRTIFTVETMGKDQIDSVMKAIKDLGYTATLR